MMDALERVLRLRYEARLATVAAPLLDRLGGDGKSHQNRRDLIIKLVVAQRLDGAYDTPAFWGRPDTVSATTFNRYKRHDDAFNDVWREVDALWPAVQLAVADEVSAEAVARIRQESLKSVDRIVTLRDGAESEQVQLSAARDLLDRNPHTAKNQRTALGGLEDAPPIAIEDVSQLSLDERFARIVALLDGARARRADDAA